MKHNMRIFSTTLFLSIFLNSYADTSKTHIDHQMQNLLDQHYQQYKNIEYFSAAALSIYIPGEKIHSYYAGQLTHDKNSPKVSADTLFQIGSITKSFTAAIILQLEKENKLNLQQTLNDWLPQYPKWSTVRLDALLNMSSGLPNYSDTPLWNAQEYQDLNRLWKNEELIAFAYPNNPFTPPLRQGYFYTNTGYILTDLIIQKASKHSFQHELITRLIHPAHLNNTYYPVYTLDNTIQKRMAHGYNYNQYDNPALVGREIPNNNTSWAAAAGGIISNTEDIIKWVKALFIEDTLLDANQKKKLTRMISITTGKPINETSKQDAKGFGLGVSQIDSNDSLFGKFWFYEGETLGFRAIYIYTICNGVIIASAFNSATYADNDHSKELMKSVYETILKHNPTLRCNAT